MRSRNWQRNDGSGAGRGWRIAAQRPWLVALAIAVVGSALIPATASAGPARYVFEMCDSSLPGGGVTGVRYAQNPGQPWEGVDNCEEPGGSLAIHLLGEVGPGGYATWALPIEPPPGGTMESTAVSAASCLTLPTTSPTSSTRAGRKPECFEEDRIFRLPANFRAFDVDLACDEAASAGALIYAHYFATIEIDPVPPTLKNLEGSLLSGGVIRGHGTLSAEAHDVGGGVSNVSVNVNGLPAAQPNVSNCDVASGQQPQRSGHRGGCDHPLPDRSKRQLEPEHRNLSIPQRLEFGPGLRLGLRHARGT